VPKRIEIRDHLLLPFGTKRAKGTRISDLSPIKLSAVAANGIYLSSEIPVVHIDTKKKSALRLNQYESVFGNVSNTGIQQEDIIGALRFMKDGILSCMDSPTRFETKFIEFYFEYLSALCPEPGSITDPFGPEEPMQVFNALLPIPEMQIYVSDPLENPYAREPSNNFRVDYGFWNGTKIVAIEIDGGEPEGYARDVRRDRMLRRANIDVIHILNMEVEKHGMRIINRLLPSEFLYDWRSLPAPRWNPVADPPF